MAQTVNRKRCLKGCFTTHARTGSWRHARTKDEAEEPRESFGQFVHDNRELGTVGSNGPFPSLCPSALVLSLLDERYCPNEGGPFGRWPANLEASATSSLDAELRTLKWFSWRLRSVTTDLLGEFQGRLDAQDDRFVKNA